MRQRFARYQAGSIPSNRENRLCVVGLNEQNTADGRKKGNPGPCQHRIRSGRLGGEHFIPQLQHCGDAILKRLYFNAHEFLRFAL